MKRIIGFAVMILFIFCYVNGSAQNNSPLLGALEITDHFRTVTSGNWNSLTTWESSPDGINWVPATTTPYDTSNTITIRTGDTVTVTETVNVDQVTVETGGSVLVNGTPVIFTIKDGPGAVDMLVNGLLKSQGIANASPGPHTVNAEGVLSFGNGGVFEHGQNAGAVPISEWGPGSTLKISGSTNTAPANRTQNYYNLVFDSPALTSNLNMGFTNHTISGDITIANTNTGRWQLCGPVVDSSATLNILGDVIHTGGNFATTGTGNGNTTIIINHYGDIIASAGNFSISRGSQGGTGTTNWYLHNGSITMSNVTTQNSNVSGARFVFMGNEQNLTLSNMSYGGGGLPIRVDDGAIVNLGTSVIQGNGAFTVNDFGGINTAQDSGFVQNLLTTGTVTLSSLGNYGYNGSVAQVTDNLLPVNVNDLTIDNAAGVTLIGTVQVFGILNLLNGNLHLDGNNINIGPAGVLIETPGNTVTGLTGSISAMGDLSAGVPNNVGGLGVMVTSDGNVTGMMVIRSHSEATGNGNEGIFRQYFIDYLVDEDIPELAVSVRFYYDESELNSIPEANLRVFHSTDFGNNWVGIGGTVNTTDNYVELTNFNDLFLNFTLADVNNPIPVELTSFSATTDGRSVKLDWITASEINNLGWNIERKYSESEWTSIGFISGHGTSTEIKNYSFTDEKVKNGKVYFRLKQLDYSGEYSYSNIVEVDVKILPVEFALEQNYPNPFNPLTTINFEVPKTSNINISVYSVIGEKVATIANEIFEVGRYSRTFDGSELSTGIYIYRLSADEVVFTKKMLMIK